MRSEGTAVNIAVDDSCVSAFQDLKAKREINTVIYRFTDAMDALVVAFQGNVTHDELLAAVPVSDPVFVVYDLPFADPDGTRRNTVVMISWCPARADAAQRAASAAGYSALKDALDGVEVFVEATEHSELEYQELVSRAG